MDKKIIIATTIIAGVLLAAIFGYLLLNAGQESSLKKESSNAILENTADTSEKITDSAVKGVLPSLETNVLENKPNINPAENANPIKNIKTNPF